MSLEAVTAAIVGEGWTLGSLAAHQAEMRAADNRYNDAMRVAAKYLNEERDRRYAEVNVEKEKALKIKETADLAALELARESQAYKEDKTDKAREQSLRETGQYVTHGDLEILESKLVKIIEPLVDFVSSQRGVVNGAQLTIGKISAAIAGSAAIIGVIFGLIAIYFKL